MNNYIDEIIADSIPIWEECINTKFVQELINGTLSDERMVKYIVEDTRYLFNYAKCFALLISKCNNLEEIRFFYDILAFVNEGETSVRKTFLKNHNIDDNEVQTTIPDIENQIYIDSMLNWCSNGTLIEGTMSVLPCMLSYEYIFNKCYKENPHMLDNNPYYDVLKEYVGEEVTNWCKEWSSFANKLMNKYPNSLEKCKRIFRFSSIREREFWNMSYNNKLEFTK